MKHIAIIKDGLVIDVAVWDGRSQWDPGNEYTLVDVTGMSVGPGWTYDGLNFTQPIQPENI